MQHIKPITLQGQHIRLEPITLQHRDALREASLDERIWAYNATKAYGDKFDAWFDKALRYLDAMQLNTCPEQLPFIVRRMADQAIVGSTRFYDILPTHRRLTVGYTWYTVDAWGTAVNPECKYLLLQHAFETWQFNRVELVTDVRNLRSRAAIKKLGATEEGILRQHMVLEDGHIRDTVMHSITQSEWPTIKLNLEKRLQP